jgi:hypothetical protein
MTFSRRGSDNAALGRAYARADAPGGREADAERLAALVRALTGREPRVRRRNDGTVETICNGEHLRSHALLRTRGRRYEVVGGNKIFLFFLFFFQL